MTQANVVTVIQARSGSSRLPGKVLLSLGQATVLEQQIARVQAAALIGRVVVATTTEPHDDPIVQLCVRLGVACFRGHPTDLLDRHRAAAAIFDAAHVVKIPSDCPLIDPMVIDEVLGFYLEHADEFDYVSNLHPASRPDGFDVEVFSREALEIAWREARQPHEREHTTPFIWGQPERFRIGNVRRGDGRDFSHSHRVVLDYAEDLAVIRHVFEALSPTNPMFTVDDVVECLDAHPAVTALNAKYRGATRAVLEALALRVRTHVVRMATGGGCFLGASLSCTDLIVYLYSRFLRVDASRVADPDRDILLLSKGHDVPALYGTLAEFGFFPTARLANHLSTGDALYWHPNRSIPGVEFHSGSLGHLLAVGMGVAYDARLRDSSRRVVVILGDGELNEGSVWETALVAAAHRLDNLIAVVDRNEFQANARTEELIPLEPLADKWSAFGWNVTTVDGHDFDDLERVFRSLPVGSGRPCVVIAHTVRGKGLPSIEARADRWFCNMSPGEIDSLLAELAGGATATLYAEPLVVR